MVDKLVCNRRRAIGLGGSTLALGLGVATPVLAAWRGGNMKRPIPRHSLEKTRNFDLDFADDVYVAKEQVPILLATAKKLTQVRRLVGAGNFNLLGFDEMLAFQRNYPQLQPFTRAELDFLDQIFHTNAQTYGFWGAKVIDRITSTISQHETIKIAHTGHYLYRGEALALYKKLRRDVGSSVYLISGIRSVVKQVHLFLLKTISVQGNLSRASRSLAPPGHSYHGIGDFDVGKVGLGAANFTDRFAQTREYQRLMELGYVSIRYSEDNSFGVRYEPWHIKVVS